MTFVIINPGTGPVEGKKKKARKNAKAFLEDLELPGAVLTDLHKEYDGRWAFDVSYACRTVELLIPGVRCRYEGRGLPAGDWLPPRLYVDGNSYFWYWAVRVAKDRLTGEE